MATGNHLLCHVLLLALPLCLLLPLVVTSPVHASDLKLGTAAVKITPPLGAPMAGYFHNRGAEGVHDDLYAKALVIEKDGQRAALVVCDLIKVPRDLVEKVRAIVTKEAGIPGDHVMVSATHAHTGPVLADEADKYNLKGAMRTLAVEYYHTLPGKVADSVLQAIRNATAVKVSAATGHEDSVDFNRRYFMKDGTVAWNPGKLNTDIVKPAGPIDPEVPVVYFETSDARPVATYVNFAMHLDTVGGLAYSADYPLTLAAILGKVKGPSMITLFSIGTAGNVNHFDVRNPSPQYGNQEAERIGTVLAGEVLKTYTRLRSLSAEGMMARSRVAKLPLAPIKPGEEEWARRIMAQFGEADAAPFLDLVKADQVTAVVENRGQPVEAEVQVIALGPELAWVGLPGEVFVELGMAIKMASPFRHTIVVELASDDIGYVPNRKAYAEGAYEVVSSRVAEGSGEMLVDTATQLLKEVHQKLVSH